MSDTSSASSIFGIILAGGLARRMGGGDKGLKTVGGKPILARVIATLQGQCAGLVLNANGDLARLAAFGLPIAADEVEDFAGPLAGLLAGLDWIAAHHPQTGFALTAPTDTPFLPMDLAARLAAAQSASGTEIVVATSGGSTHPVVALWSLGLREDLRKALFEEKIHKVGFFASRHKVAYADWPVTPYDPFFNANEPQDLEEAEKILKALERVP